MSFPAFITNRALARPFLAAIANGVAAMISACTVGTYTWKPRSVPESLRRPRSDCRGIRQPKRLRGLWIVTLWKVPDQAASTDRWTTPEELDELHIQASLVGYAVMSRLEHFPRLRVLYLVRIGVTVAGLRATHNFDNIRRLVLDVAAPATMSDILRCSFGHVRTSGHTCVCRR